MATGDHHHELTEKGPNTQKLEQLLADHKIIGLDTSIFIYHFEAHPRYYPLTKIILASVERGRWQGIISPITLMEVTVRPWQLEQDNIARQYEVLLVNFPNLHMALVDRHIARQAAKLRARHRLRPADAIIAATAMSRNATMFVTNDRQFARLAPLMEIIQLDDLSSNEPTEYPSTP